MSFKFFGSQSELIFGHALKWMLNMGITHVFSCINICQVQRKLFEHETTGWVFKSPYRVWLCTAPHHTAPVKIQYRTDGNCRNMPTNSVPDASINLMWHFVLEVGIVGHYPVFCPSGIENFFYTVRKGKQPDLCHSDAWFTILFGDAANANILNIPVISWHSIMTTCFKLKKYSPIAIIHCKYLPLP